MPDRVYAQVRERIDIFAPGGGFVFNNVQSNVPDEKFPPCSVRSATIHPVDGIRNPTATA